jgi:hypothetical protein
MNHLRIATSYEPRVPAVYHDADRLLSSQTTRIEMVIEKFVYSTLNHMTRLLAREYFIDMSNYLCVYASLTPQKANIWLRYKLRSSQSLVGKCRCLHS